MKKVNERLGELILETSSLSFSRGKSRLVCFSEDSDPDKVEDRLKLAGRLVKLTGRGKGISLHIPLDARNEKGAEKLAELLTKNKLKPVATYPDLLCPRKASALDHRLSFGSFTSPYSELRVASINHVIQTLKLMRLYKCRQVVLWIPDGANSPGEKNLISMIDRILNGLRQISFKLRKSERMMLEYKPFDPSFYAAAVSDWGTAAWLCRETDPSCKVVLDFESLLPGSNFENVSVAALRSGIAGRIRLTDTILIGGGLPAGSLNSDALFRMFLNVLQVERAGYVKLAEIPFSFRVNAMTGDIFEANLQAVENIEFALAKALLVDLDELEKLQNIPDITRANRLVRNAFMTDVRNIVKAYKETSGLPVDPLEVYRKKKR